MKKRLAISSALAAILLLLSIGPALAQAPALTFAFQEEKADTSGLTRLALEKGGSLSVTEADWTNVHSAQVLLVSAGGRAQYLSNETVTAPGAYGVPAKVGQERIREAYLYNIVPFSATHKVVFRGLDGNAVLATQYVADGACVDGSRVPVIENTDTRRVLGWMCSDTGEPFSLTDPVKEHLRLEPLVLNIYRVDCIGADGRVIYTEYVAEGGRVSALPALAAAGAPTAVGWCTQEGGQAFFPTRPIFRSYRLVPLMPQ